MPKAKQKTKGAFKPWKDYAFVRRLFEIEDRPKRVFNHGPGPDVEKYLIILLYYPSIAQLRCMHFQAGSRKSSRTL